MTEEAKKKKEIKAGAQAMLRKYRFADIDFKEGFDAGYQVAMDEANERIKQLEAESAALKVKLSIADEALLWAEEMFIARDGMNAKVHCSPVRFSEITLRVVQARAALKKDDLNK